MPAEKDAGDSASDLDGDDGGYGGYGAGRLCSTVPSPICMQNLHTKSSLPYKNSMGFYREGTKSAYLCVMVRAGEPAVC